METNTRGAIFLVEATNVVRRVILKEVAIRVSPLDDDGQTALILKVAQVLLEVGEMELRPDVFDRSLARLRQELTE